jgi:hypothetical protein
MVSGKLTAAICRESGGKSGAYKMSSLREEETVKFRSKSLISTDPGTGRIVQHQPPLDRCTVQKQHHLDRSTVATSFRPVYSGVAAPSRPQCTHNFYGLLMSEAESKGETDWSIKGLNEDWKEKEARKGKK